MIGDSGNRKLELTYSQSHSHTRTKETMKWKGRAAAAQARRGDGASTEGRRRQLKAAICAAGTNGGEHVAIRRMKLIQGALRSLNAGLSHQFQCPLMIRALSTGANDIPNTNSFESIDDFEQRIFGDVTGNGSNSKSFYEKLDRIEKAHDRTGFGTNFNIGNRSEFMDGLDESFNTLSDGMDGKLKEAASYFEVDEDEIWEDEDYSYRPDVNFDRIGETYDTKDLDLRQPGVWKPAKKYEFEVTTEEVLRKADFRNVRFLANFITDAGIIIKRSKTKISAKAQRKVAREIKTARAFGLMPFTTMGTKHFAFGKTMENLDEDYEFETYDNYNFVDEEASQNPL